MASAPQLSVVVGTFNRLPALQRCIASIRAETHAPVVIYVTDAGSTDGTQDYLANIACDEVVPVLVGRKLGQAKAYNDVFKRVETPFVAWLSDDNVVVNGGLDIALRILAAKPAVGMVGLKVRDVQGPFVSAPYIGGISEIGILNVNQGLLRTELLRRVGYFSENFAFYGIDPDLTAMVLFSGHDVVFTKQVAVHHYRDWPTDRSSPQYDALKHQQTRALDLYSRKYRGFNNADKTWALKKKVLQHIKSRLGTRWAADSSKPVLGALFRDWQNAFGARYINPLDPWLSLGREFHLRQRVARRHLPSNLPQDPVVAVQKSAPRQEEIIGLDEIGAARR